MINVREEGGEGGGGGRGGEGEKKSSETGKETVKESRRGEA